MYHLKILIFAFNNRLISNNEFTTNFLNIAPFSDGNKQTEYCYLVYLKTKTN